MPFSNMPSNNKTILQRLRDTYHHDPLMSYFFVDYVQMSKQLYKRERQLQRAHHVIDMRDTEILQHQQRVREIEDLFSSQQRLISLLNDEINNRTRYFEDQLRERWTTINELQGSQPLPGRLMDILVKYPYETTVEEYNRRNAREEEEDTDSDTSIDLLTQEM